MVKHSKRFNAASARVERGRLYEPGENPAATRTGIPAILSRRAIAPENCWQ